MQEPQQHELVIIRRRPDPEAEEVKGGTWKIAYADFMTAMMAFFLVMWLINATDQETREVVADYFNPIRLAEATSDRKGLRDPDESSQGVDLEERSDAPVTDGDEAVEADTPRNEPERRYSETALFQDPYAVLAELSAQATFARANPATGIDVRPGDRGEAGLSGGDAYRDPFDPVYWQLGPQVAVGRSDGDGSGGPMGAPDALAPVGRGGPAGSAVLETEIAAMLPLDDAATAAMDGPIALDGETRPTAGADAASAEVEGTDAAQAVETEAVETEVAETAPEAETVDIVAAEVVAVEVVAAEVVAAEVRDDDTATELARSEAAAEPDPALAQAAALRARIAEAMASATGAPAPGRTPAIEVAATPEGVLVSLTDAADFGMFAIGSAEPRPELVRVLEEIAPILAQEAGAIVIRGHTDGRPFRSETYDNWRLSSARAHMAYYMLVRGGFAEERILRVEGHADRLLKVSDDPNAAQNRRIEILLSASEART